VAIGCEADTLAGLPGRAAQVAVREHRALAAYAVQTAGPRPGADG
jgi:hypothetical protein